MLGQSVPLGCQVPGTGPNTSCQEPTKRRGGAGGREAVRIEVSELSDPESLGIRIWCVCVGHGKRKIFLIKRREVRKTEEP